MRVLFHRASGTGAVSETFDPNHAIRILQVKFTLSADGMANEFLTASIDADAGAAFDGQFLNDDMASAQTLIRGYDPAILIDKGDVLNFTFANSGSATWGLEVAFERND